MTSNQPFSNSQVKSSISCTTEIIAEIRAGRMVVMVDDEDRENEGDLIIAADHITPASINFMARHARGLICLTLTKEVCQRLELTPMTEKNGAQHSTAFMKSIEAAVGVTTGISAADRAKTVQAAVADNAVATDIVQPGHIFPLCAVDGGVLVRAGHTEAGSDLALLAGCSPTSVICEVMNDDGTMARLPNLCAFANEHGLKIGTIADLIEYRCLNERLIARVGIRSLNTPWGIFDAYTYHSRSDTTSHVALKFGECMAADTISVFVHQCRSILELFDVELDGTTSSLAGGFQEVASSGKGIIVMLNCEEDYVGRHRKVAPKYDSISPVERRILDKRMISTVAQILCDQNVHRIQLFGANDADLEFTAYEIEVQGSAVSVCVSHESSHKELLSADLE